LTKKDSGKLTQNSTATALELKTLERRAEWSDAAHTVNKYDLDFL